MKQLEFQLKDRVFKKELSSPNGRELDQKIPIQEVRFQYGIIQLRQLENGIWIWGMDYAIPAKGCGGAFPPLRQHGPDFAARTRQAAISDALAWIKDAFNLELVKLLEE